MTHTKSILVGTVTRKTDDFHKGLPYTEITLDVGQSIKGNHSSSYTFRQFGLIEPKSTVDVRVNLMVTPVGWPVYAKVMLFLHKPASETGPCSPDSFEIFGLESESVISIIPESCHHEIDECPRVDILTSRLTAVLRGW